MNRERRRFLAAVAGVSTTGIAGCADGSTSDPATTAQTTTVTVEQTTTRTTTTAGEQTTAEKTTTGTTGTTTAGRIVVEGIGFPSTMGVGTSGEIRIAVVNPGGETVTGDVVIHVGETTVRKSVTLEANESTLVFASFQPNQPGSYEVRIDGQSRGTIQVVPAAYRQFNYDSANTGHGYGPVPTVKLATRTVVETPSSGVSPPVTDGETVYVGLRERREFAAVDVVSGSRVWTVDTGDFEPERTPVLADDVVYTAEQSTENGRSRVVARSSADGSEQWTVGGSEIGGLAFETDTLYVSWTGTTTGVAAIRTDGSVAWTKPLLDADAERTGYGVSPPAVENGTVYATVDTDRTGLVFALEAASGDRAWSAELGGAGPSPPVVGQDVYVRSTDGLHVLTSASGDQGYTSEFAPGTTFVNVPNPAPALADGVLYGCSGDTLQAYDVAKEKRAWTVTVGECGSASPVVVNGFVVVLTEGGHVVGVSTADGSPEFDVSVGGNGLNGTAVVAGGRVVAATTAGVSVVEETA